MIPILIVSFESIRKINLVFPCVAVGKKLLFFPAASSAIRRRVLIKFCPRCHRRHPLNSRQKQNQQQNTGQTADFASSFLFIAFRPLSSPLAFRPAVPPQRRFPADHFLPAPVRDAVPQSVVQSQVQVPSRRYRGSSTALSGKISGKYDPVPVLDDPSVVNDTRDHIFALFFH